MIQFIYICCCCFSVAESCPILCDPMNCSTAGYRLPSFPVHHYLPEFPQTHIHWVLSQWCHPTISSSVAPLPPALNFPQHQGLFQGVSSSYQVAKVWSLSSSISLSNEYSGWFPLGWRGLFSLQSKGLARVFSSTTVRKCQFFGTQPSLWYMFHIHTWLLEKP